MHGSGRSLKCAIIIREHNHRARVTQTTVVDFAASAQSRRPVRFSGYSTGAITTAASRSGWPPPRVGSRNGPHRKKAEPAIDFISAKREFSDVLAFACPFTEFVAPPAICHHAETSPAVIAGIDDPSSASNRSDAFVSGNAISEHVPGARSRRAVGR
jgi:hypothetical protein